MNGLRYNWLSSKESCLPMQETWVQSLVWWNSLKKEMTIHSKYSCLGNPRRQRSLAGLQPMGLQESQTWRWLNNNNNEWTLTSQFPQLLLSLFLGGMTQFYFCVIKPHFCYRSRGPEGLGWEVKKWDPGAENTTVRLTIYWKFTLWPSLCQLPCLWSYSSWVDWLNLHIHIHFY